MTVMDTPERQNLRAEVRALCQKFDDEYWRRCDEERAYPDAFVEAMTEAGYLSALIPAEYGGLGLGITDAAIILEEVNRSGGHSAACHAQMYTMGALLKHGNAEQKRRYLPEIARAPCGCRRSPSPSRTQAPTPRTSPRSPSAPRTATA